MFLTLEMRVQLASSSQLLPGEVKDQAHVMLLTSLTTRTDAPCLPAGCRESAQVGCLPCGYFKYQKEMLV